LKISVSVFRARLLDYLKQVDCYHERVYITFHGKVKGVVIALSELEELEKRAKNTPAPVVDFKNDWQNRDYP